MISDSRPVVVWRFIDAKPGHENQSAGLVQALAKLVAVEVHDIPVSAGWGAWWSWLMGVFPAGKALPDPDLLVGAGHATHVPMLAARRARGGRAVVLMKPTLPYRWFDLCIMPEHDGTVVSDKVLVSRGVLNRIDASAEKDQGAGLILVGGPSRHHGWQGEVLCECIGTLLQRDPGIRWQLATSRRTPAEWMATLQPLLDGCEDRLRVVPYQETTPDWLPAQLGGASRVWVTADSVSMVYEALTSGAAVGVLPMPVRHTGRVTQGLDRLMQEGAVVDYATWSAHGVYPEPQAFNEAQRCARWITEHWLNGN